MADGATPSLHKPASETASAPLTEEHQHSIRSEIFWFKGRCCQCCLTRAAKHGHRLLILI